MDRLFGVVAVALIVTSFVHWLYFIVVPRRVAKSCTGRSPEWLRRYLEWVVATPTFVPSSKLASRGLLAGIYLRNGRHAEAAAQYRAILDSLTRLPSRIRASLEADTRRRLADCLEALGQTEEAAEELRRAEMCVSHAPADALRHLTQGTLLERQHRYEEAYREHHKALEVTPLANRAVRIECMIHMVLAAYNAAWPEDCLHWAEEAIASGATGKSLRIAHRMAGIACGNLGRLEESERHVRQAYDVAAAQNSRPEMAELLASLGGCLRKRGRLVEANEACINAAELDPKGERMAKAVQSQILREWGRYDEALALLARHDDAGQLVIPHFERRIRAVRALDTARIETEAGRPSDAWAHIQEALAELGDDPKLSLKCDATASWVLAARGFADESQRLAKMLDARIATFEGDPSTQRGVLYDLGMAAVARGDYEAGIDCWSRYLALRPDPVHKPTAYYHRGECYRELDRRAEARNDYEAAVAMNLDTHSSGLARRRLADLRFPVA